MFVERERSRKLEKNKTLRDLGDGATHTRERAECFFVVGASLARKRKRKKRAQGARRRHIMKAESVSRERICLAYT